MDGILGSLLEEYAGREIEIREAFYALEKQMVRRMILDEKKRIDGRSFTDIRSIECAVGILPRVHGAALFTRGETQAMVLTTLGTERDEQRIESIYGEQHQNFILHYNFPPYSVGEARRLTGPGRREIGHGALARRALLPVMPGKDDFEYSIRVVSEIIESNGSSSMASVCGSSLSLMDAGVPIKEAVAGVAMGLVSDGKNLAVLTVFTVGIFISGCFSMTTQNQHHATAVPTTLLRMDNKILQWISSSPISPHVDLESLWEFGFFSLNASPSCILLDRHLLQLHVLLIFRYPSYSLCNLSYIVSPRNDSSILP